LTTYAFIDESGETRLRGTIDPAPSGTPQFLTATVQLTNADIIALGTEASFEIVAAPAAGTFFNVVYGLLVVDASAAPYGNIDTGAGMAMQASGASSEFTTDPGIIAALLGGDGVPAWIHFPATPQTYGEAAGDQNLILATFNNGQGAFTGGDAANSGYVKAWYTVEDLP